jgi:hypothetical protein
LSLRKYSIATAFSLFDKVRNRGKDAITEDAATARCGIGPLDWPDSWGLRDDACDNGVALAEFNDLAGFKPG